MSRESAEPGPSGRNLFDDIAFIDADDDQSDLEIEQEEVSSEEEDSIYTDRSRSRSRSRSREINETGDTGDRTADATATPTTATDGWSLDCSEIGTNIVPFTSNVGPSHPLSFDAQPIHYFHQLVPEIFFQKLADETNLYAAQKRQDKIRAQPNNDPPPQWTETTAAELKAFMAIHIFMGINKMPNYRMYWSSDMTFNQAFVSNMMTRNRYEDLSSNFHVNDRTSNPPYGQNGHDPLHKVRPILDLVQKTWPEHHNPHKEMCVDEAMIAFKGRCSFRQYLPAKPVKWGLKVWSICDSHTYYMLNMSVYTGKKNDLGNEGEPLGDRVVKKMTESYYEKFHVVYIDNFFTSLPLVRFLLEHGTYCCGTIRVNRVGLPREIKNPRCVRKPGDIVRLQKDSIQAIAWFDRRKVTLVSTVHTSADNAVTRRRGATTDDPYLRPNAIEEYSKHYNGVDKNDQL